MDVLRISELLQPQHVIYFENSATPLDVYSLLVCTWTGVDRKATLKAIYDREKISPTLIDPQITVPHARLAGFGPLRAALGLCPKGLTGSNGNSPSIQIVLLFAGDVSKPRDCLAFLSSAAALFGLEGLKDRLVQLADPQKVVEFLHVAETRGVF